MSWNTHNKEMADWMSILSKRCPRKLLVHLPVVEYWSLKQPFVNTKRFIGSLDYTHIVSEEKLVLRGWLFFLPGKIDELELSIADNWYPVPCYGLARFDVTENFPFVPHSLNSGFVFECPYRPLGAQEQEHVVLQFRAKTRSSISSSDSPLEVHNGEFEQSKFKRDFFYT